jgi:hypothetical protein
MCDPIIVLVESLVDLDFFDLVDLIYVNATSVQQISNRFDRRVTARCGLRFRFGLTRTDALTVVAYCGLAYSVPLADISLGE